MAEVGTFGRTCHINLVRLYGFCFDATVKALVYEYMENGSLDQHLFGVGVWGGGVRPEAVDQRGAGRATSVGAARPLPRRCRGAALRRGRPSPRRPLPQTPT